MEISVATVSISMVVIIILTTIWKVVNWVWVRPRKLEKYLREQGFSGNSYRFLFGDLKDESRMRLQAQSHPMNFSHDIIPRVIPFLDQTVNNYGKNSFTWFGPKPRLHITDTEKLKIILSNINEFQKPNSNPLVNFLVTGLVNYEGDKWVKHRKIINPAFHVEKLKNMLPAFEQSCSDVIREWETRISALGENSCEIDVWPSLQNLSNDAISRTSFGSSYEEGKKIFQLLRLQGELVAQALQTIYIPGWRFVPTKMNKRIKEVDKEMKGLLWGIIKKREVSIKKGEAINDDLLSTLMESNYKEIKENGNDSALGMSIQDVIEECKLFYFAGQETTSVLLVWTMIVLARHQDWQDRARAEVLEVFGNKKPDFDGINRLKLVNMILYEVLRLYPPVIFLTRKVHRETKLGNLSLPAGVLLSLPIIYMHQDREIWGDDAKVFRPERFSEGVSKATKKQVSFFPFGWGPRICIGQNFAMVEAKLALSMILQHFSFELSPSYTHAPFTVLTLQPQHGAHIILHKLE